MPGEHEADPEQSTTNPDEAAASSASDSHDGPSENAAVEMMPVAITYAKEAGWSSLTAAAALIGDADLAPPAAAGGGLGRRCGLAAAVVVAVAEQVDEQGRNDPGHDDDK
jgi:hypothetical protein